MLELPPGEWCYSLSGSLIAVTGRENSFWSRWSVAQRNVQSHGVVELRRRHKVYIARIPPRNHALLFARTFGTFPREYSPLSLRGDIGRIAAPEMPIGITARLVSLA